jgi:hypothetical protein
MVKNPRRRHFFFWNAKRILVPPAGIFNHLEMSDRLISLGGPNWEVKIAHLEGPVYQETGLTFESLNSGGIHLKTAGRLPICDAMTSI